MRNSGSPYKMQRERHKWAVPTRLTVSMLIGMTDAVVVATKSRVIRDGAKGGRHTVSIM
jgi:hypothetical protein